MYQLKNGILYHNNRPRFALGQSYYPSYHPQKVPVPEGGDRIRAMKQDLRDMRDAGFFFVRIAALGEISLQGDALEMQFDLPKAILAEMDELDMAAMVRLQGYSIDLHGRDDALMLDQDGNEMPFYWSWFVRNCLNHPGIMEDNRQVTLESAKLFGSCPHVVSYQIYNEAAYPTQGFYDYNPHTLEAFRSWLADTGRMTPEEAASCDPPRRRPGNDGNVQEWVNFRMFNLIRMSGFLGDLADTARAGNPNAETLTCHMASPCLPGMAMHGEDYFDIAQRMDIVGITHYVMTKGPDYFTASLVLDAAESAAAVYGKHAWLIEYNARADCTLNEWERETYNAVGAGYKGILYYQWRADYPFPDSPEPNGFGMVLNDGTKTPKFDGAAAMTRQLDALSAYIVTSEKVRSGIAIVYSQHAGMWYDALDNGAEADFHRTRNRYIEYLQRLYTRLRSIGFVPDLVRACDLGENRLDTRLLFTPVWEGLSSQEQADIRSFAEEHPVYVYQAWGDRFTPLGQKSEQISAYCLEAVLARHMQTPAACVTASHQGVSAGLLAGSNHRGRHLVAALVNYDDEERPAETPCLHLRAELAEGLNHAVWITPREQTRLTIHRDGQLISLQVPVITTGGYVILSEQPVQLS